MTIAILDSEHQRVIVAQLPEYLENLDRDHQDIAEAIIQALGLSLDNVEYMFGNLTLAIDVQSLNSGRGYGDNTRRLDEFTQDFKEDVLAALEESK